MNINVVNIDDESVGLKDNYLQTNNIQWHDKKSQKQEEEFQSA